MFSVELELGVPFVIESVIPPTTLLVTIPTFLTQPAEVRINILMAINT